MQLHLFPSWFTLQVVAWEYFAILGMSYIYVIYRIYRECVLMCCIRVCLQCVLCVGVFPVCPMIKGEFWCACLPRFDLFSFFLFLCLVILTIDK